MKYFKPQDDDSVFNKYPPRKAVLVYLIKERPRALSGVSGSLLSTHRPGDWAIYGFEECQAEYERRRKINALMTEHERAVFAKYCRLRDD